MIRERLEQLTGELSDSLFQEIMAVTTDDVKWNGITFKQRTSFDDLIERACIAHEVCTKYEAICDEHSKENNPSKVNYYNNGAQLKNKAG
jgi:hypothetical protein